MEEASPKNPLLKIGEGGIKKFLTINAGVFLLSLGVYFFKFSFTVNISIIWSYIHKSCDRFS